MSIELYSEQDAETKVIVPTLESLGYIEGDSGRDVVVRYRHPIEAQQGRESRKIFADIVVFVDGKAAIVVDSKNPRQHLTDNDRKQVISYARLVGTVAPYAVLCNGHTWQIFDTVTGEQLEHVPPYSDLVQRLQHDPISGRQRDSLKGQATRTLFAIDSARELSRLLRRCHDVIRNLKGYDPTKAFDELSKLLFVKMYEEREVADGREANRFTSSFVANMREQGVEIIPNLWTETVQSSRYSDVFSDLDASERIDLPPEAIDEIVKILEDKSLGQTDLDVKGVAFEEFLAATYRGGGLGQYFTPREVVNFMVDMVRPTIGDTVIDPACGSGGFLIRVYDEISEKIRTSELSTDAKSDALEELANTSLVGFDWEARAARTCKMNMIIHGDGHAGVYQANALDLEEIAEKVSTRQRTNPNALDIDDGTFDIVLTNPPFGAKDDSKNILKHFSLGRGSRQKREVLMLERCIRLLKPGGRMAIVIPEGILSNKNDRHIREYICKHCEVKAVIRLPQEAFKMSEGAACTSILYAIKKPVEGADKKSGIFFSRAQNIGISPSGRQTDENDLPAIRESYRKFERGEWDGTIVRQTAISIPKVVRDVPSEVGPWYEPDVDRTSLLYDRQDYVVSGARDFNRFSYTYFHPRYCRIMEEIDSLQVPSPPLSDLCISSYPSRGKKPSEDSFQGIPILKVRNITGTGIDFDTDFAPDTLAILVECSRALVIKNDVLVTSTGEGTIGKVDIYSYDEPAIADGHVTICRLHDGINPLYILEYLRSEHGQVQLLRHVSGSTGQTELLIGHLQSIRIPLPDADTQATIATSMSDARRRISELQLRASNMLQESSDILADARREMVRQLTSRKS